MKILYILSTLFRGGAEKTVLHLGSRVREAGNDVTVLALHEGGDLVRDFRTARIPVRVRRTLRNALKDLLPPALLEQYYRYQLRRNRDEYLRHYGQPLPATTRLSREKFVKTTIRNRTPDIVHVHQAQCTDALEWAKECGVRCVIYTHHSMTNEVLGIDELASVNRLIGFADWLTFVSEAQRKDFLGEVSYPPERTTVQYPQTGFVGTPKVRYRQSPVLTLGTMSNLSPNKNLTSVLEALRRLRDEGRMMRLLIAGGNLRWKVPMEEEVEKRGLADCVRFLGTLRSNQKLQEFFSEVDIYVSSSLSESFSLTTMEAMSCGVPVVASDVPPVRELVADGVSGLIFRRGNVEDLISKIVYFSEDPTRIQATGERAAEKVREMVLRQSMSLAYLNLYDQLLRDWEPAQSVRPGSGAVQ